jgi:hypothetical protein
MKASVAAIVLLALMGSAAAVAADEAKFYPPDGWTVAKQPDGTAAVQPPGVPAGKTCTIVIMPDVQGEVNGVFATSWRTLTGEVKVVSGGEPRARKSMAELETRSTTAVVDASDTGRAYMHFFAVQAGPNVRRVLFVSDDRGTFDEHLPAVKAMLDAVGVDPGVAKQKRDAAVAKGENTGLEGVFYRGSVEFEAAGAPGQREIRVDFLCLAADGRAYTGRPTGGPGACFDAQADDPRSASYGRYTLSGDEVVIQWNRQANTQKLKRRADGKLGQETIVYHKLEACDGLRLDGTYAITWGDGTKSRVAFSKDGRFTEDGLKHCVNLDNLVYPDWPKLPEKGAGTYSIAKNTLEVTYDNGPSRRMFFFTPDDPANNPGRIAIANYPLAREQ